MPSKYQQLSPAGKRLARIPRFGRLIGRLPDDKVGGKSTETEAALFWRLYSFVGDSFNDETGLFDHGLRASQACRLGLFQHDLSPTQVSVFRQPKANRQWQVQLSMAICGAMAFLMFLGGNRAERKKPIDRFVGQMSDFLRDVGQLLLDSKSLNLNENQIRCPSHAISKCDAGPYVGVEGKSIEPLWLFNDVECLRALNADGLSHLVLTDTNRSILFADVSTQAFFAAYWACRWSNDEHLVLMRDWLPDPWTNTNAAYREFWQMVIDMPQEAICSRRWERLLAPLYDGSWIDDAGLPIRSTELIYKSWDRMRHTAAGLQFSKEFAKVLLNDDHRGRTARAILRSDDSEHESAECCFISCCQQHATNERFCDTGYFMMGTPPDECPDWDGLVIQNNPAHPVTLTHFRMHRSCVTNDQFELFDLRRRLARAFSDKTHDDLAQHPVVNVTWFDAWCFATWLGSHEIDGLQYHIALPSEAQWEYACRCGRSTPFTWDKGVDGNRIEPSFAIFDGRSPWNKSGVYIPPGIERTMTSSVNLLPPNEWGFFQMHGNVWEWCADWFDSRYYADCGLAIQNPSGPKFGTSRVLRGGSWGSTGIFCRSGVRNGTAPGDQLRTYGFRLAAIPLAKEP